MRAIANRSKWLFALIGLFLFGLCILGYRFFTNAEGWTGMKYNKHLFESGTLVSGGKILDREGVPLAYNEDGARRFNDDRAIRMSTLHTIGDLEGYISTGIHARYKSVLTGYSYIDGLYNTVANGSGNDITLTISAELCATAYRALDGRKGVVGVYNYRTGEVLCCTSAPSFDTRNRPSEQEVKENDSYEGVYIDRFVSGEYVPGSIFKIVTAAAAIDNIPDIYSQTFECDGEYNIGEGIVKCNGVHGKISFEKALSHSCNCAFAQIAEQLGNQKLQEEAEKLGFNDSSAAGGNYLNFTGNKIDLSKAKKLDLGWAGIGQYTTKVNPCRYLTLVGAIANGGASPKPYVVSKITTSSGIKVFSQKTKLMDEYMSGETASKLKKMLRFDVEDVYGDWSFPNLEMCGKTGTAEVGGDKRPHAWFVGFSQREDLPLAVVVIIENGGSGSGNAIPVANRVMQEAKKLYEN
ncbi:MAG: penicillin-binding protein [Clostridia bacterium]|nr:penicillin-binding protein [Clostridia bacterium]